MKLDKYIAQLLYRYQCVTVPEFGSFLSEVRSAKHHPNTYTFYPPKKIVSFNALLKSNDGLLIHHISQNASMPYNDAVKFIQQEVASWQKILKNNETLLLEGIGEISLNSEGNLVFKADESVNYLMESFGLSSIVTPVIRRNYVTEDIAELKSNEKQVIQVVASDQVIEEKEPVVVSIDGDSKDVRRIPYLKYASIAAVLLLSVGVYFSDYQYGKRVDAQTLALKQEVQNEVHDRIQKATFVLENPTLAPITLTVKEQQLSYHIVAGAFKEEFNAEKVRIDLSNQGYKSRKLPSNRFGLYPVLYESYKTQEEAQQKLKEIRKINPDAWMLIQDL